MIVAIVALLSVVMGLLLLSVIQLAVIICQLSDLNGHVLTTIGMQQQINEKEADEW